VLHVVWEFRVRPGREAEFERRYGAEGDWVRLFRLGEGYERTVLVRDLAAAGRYLVTDVWRDAASYRAFKDRHAEAYARLDAECTALTLEERLVGQFEVV
jgi:heme-degrading monooxygenase HmoA